jgi:ribosomal protein S18 acetylase RimI-like enzyme
VSQISVRLLPGSAADDAGLVARLTDLVNGVYADAERGLWLDGFTRTVPEEMAEMVRAGETAVAELAGELVGTVRVHAVGPHRGEFGLLAADPTVRGIGVGRALVAFAERELRAGGAAEMQLELLVPRDWSHPSKEFLRAWYGRLGYRLAGSRPMDEAFPHLGPFLATPCDLELYEKPLSG